MGDRRFGVPLNTQLPFQNGFDISGIGQFSGLAPMDLSTNIPGAYGAYGTSGGMGSTGPGKTGFGGTTFDKLGLGLAGLQTIGGLWAAFQQQKLAKEQFRFTKGVTETNLANQIKSYNTSLEDRARSRAVVEGQTPAQSQAYIDQNKLTKTGGY